MGCTCYHTLHSTRLELYILSVHWPNNRLVSHRPPPLRFGAGTLYLGIPVSAPGISAVANLRGVHPPTTQNFLNSMQVVRKFAKIVCLRPPPYNRGLAPPPTGNPGSAPEVHNNIQTHKEIITKTYLFVEKPMTNLNVFNWCSTSTNTRLC